MRAFGGTRAFQERDTLEDNHIGHLWKMSLTNDDEFHPINLITSIFNVEVSFHVCSFCHGLGHLLANCPYKSSWVEVQLSLLITFPLGNPPIATIFSYPNIVPRNFDSLLGIKEDKGEFLGFPNPTKTCHNFSLGLTTKEKAWKGAGWKHNLGVTITLSKVWESVREWTHTLPSGLPLWVLESIHSLECLKNNFKGQNSSIEELLVPLKISSNINV
jgi:hypothetical protein